MTIEKQIERLIDIANSILNLYNNLSDYYDDKEEYEKNLTYLKIALETENKIYKEIGESNLKSPSFLEKINHELYLRIEHSDKKISYDDCEEIKYRINNYISFLTYKYPFVSTNRNPILANNENYCTIEEHFFLDYDLLFLNYINKYIKNENLKNARDYLYFLKCQLLYRTKCFDKFAFNNPKNIKINAQNKLKLFNHNPEMVDEIFTNLIIEDLNIALNEALNYGSLEKNRENLEELIFNFLTIHVCLDLGHKNIIEPLINSYNEVAENNEDMKKLIEISPKIHHIIQRIFSETLKTKNNVCETFNKPKVNQKTSS